MSKPTYSKGDLVRSDAVGARDAFEGHIAEVLCVAGGTFRGYYYHVRDAAGALWHRSASEIQAGHAQ